MMHSFKLKVYCLGFFLLTAVQFLAQNPKTTQQPSLPEYGFSQSISAGPISVSADTRTSDPDNGKIVGTLDLDFPISNLKSSIGFRFIATWLKATEAWTYEIDTTVKSPLDDYNFRNVVLVKVNDQWRLTAELDMATLRYLAQHKEQGDPSVIKETAHFEWIEGKVSIVLGVKDMKVSYGPVSLAIRDTLDFTFNASDSVWTPSVRSILQLMQTELEGKLFFASALLQFQMDTNSSTNSSSLDEVGKLTFERLNFTIGNTQSFDGKASLQTLGDAKDLMDKAFGVVISGKPGSIRLTAAQKGDIPQLQMGKDMILNLWPVSVRQQRTEANGVKKYNYTWDIRSTMQLGSQNFSGELKLKQDTIQVLDVELVQGFPKLNITLKKTKTASAEPEWALLLAQNITSDQINAFVQGLGLGAFASSQNIPLNGLVSSEAVQITLSESPSLPAWMPSWFKGSTNSFTLTHTLAGHKSVLNFLVEGVPLGAIPGVANGTVADFAVIAGHGVSMPSFNTNHTPWFKSVWSDLGSNSISSFQWLNTGTDTRDVGVAFGLADTALAIPIQGLEHVSMSHLMGGGSNAGWNIIGEIDYPLDLSPNNPLLRVLDPSVKLVLSYNGTTFRATNNLNKAFNDIPSLGIQMDTLKLEQVPDKSWKLSAISQLSLFGVAVPGAVIFPTSGDPSFIPQIDPKGVQMNFSGAFNPIFKSLTINLGTNYSATGTAVVKKNANNFITNELDKDLELNFFLSKADGWRLATNPGATPIVSTTIGNDKIEIDSLGISEDANQNKLVGGKGTFTFSNSSKMLSTFTISKSLSIFEIPEFEPVKEVKMSGRATVSGVGAAKIYSGSVSGSIDASGISALYGLFSLSPTTTTTAANTLVSGSFTSTGDLAIQFVNLPAFSGLAQGPDMSLGLIDTISLKRVSGAESLHISTHLGIAHVAPLDDRGTGGLMTNIKLSKPALPGVPAMLDIDLKAQVAIPVGIGTLTFTDFNCSYDSVWTIDGKAHLDQVLPFVESGLDFLDIQAQFDLDLSYANGAYKMVSNIYDKSGSRGAAKVLELIPTIAKADLTSVLLGSGANGLELGLISTIEANGQKFPGQLAFDLSNERINFKPEASVSVDFTTDLAPAGTLMVEDMTFSIGQALAVSAQTVKVTAANPKDFFWSKIVKDDHLLGSFSADSEGNMIISMDLPAGGIKETLVLGSEKVNVGSANFEITEVTFSTNGGIGGKGDVKIGAAEFEVDILPGPTFSITPKNTDKLAVPTIYVGEGQTRTAFNFSSSSRFLLATNILGMETLTFDQVEFKANNVMDTSKVFFDLRFDTLVFYMDGPGMLFFDLFDGYVNMAGLDGALTMSLPDPLSPNATDKLKNALVQLLQPGGSISKGIQNLDAPAFKLAKGELLMPKVFGGGGIQLSPVDYEISDLSGFFEILEHQCKDDTKMAESFIHKSIEQAVNAATEPHTVDILDAVVKSNLNYKYGSGISYAFDFDGKPMANGTAKLTANFKSILEKGDFSLKAKGSIQMHAGSGGWHTASGCSFVLTPQKLTFKGHILKDASVTGTLDHKGFTADAHFDDAEFLDGHAHISPSGFSGEIGLQHNHDYLVKLSISKSGIISAKGTEHFDQDVGKTFCKKVKFSFDYDLSYNLATAKPSFSASVYPGKGGVICSTSFDKTTVTFKDGHVWAEFYSGTDKYHFHYSFHHSGVKNRYLENLANKKVYSID